MAEKEQLINVATIFAKDVMTFAISPQNTVNAYEKKSEALTCRGVPCLPLLESDDDDEAFSFFLKQQNFLTRLPESSTEKVNRKRKKPKNSIEVEALIDETHNKQHKTDPFQSTRTDTIPELNLLNKFDPNSFESFLHMSKVTFLNIFKAVSHLLTRSIFSNEQTAISTQTVFSLALWKLTTDEHFEEISRRFHIPLHTCHMVIRKFWHVISENYEDFIKWPNSQRSQQSTLASFQNIPQLKVFDHLFGIIAKKQLDIFLESEDEEVSVTLQIICNAERKIIDCFVEFTNEYAFDCSPIGQTLELNAQTIPTESYIIGDNSFPLRHFLIRPFEIERFRQETSFNLMLMPAIALGQSVLNAMTHRFHTLYALEAKDITEVRKVLETVSSLHNLCIDLEGKKLGTGQQATTNSSTDLRIKLGTSESHRSEKNQQGREARLRLMERILR